MIESKLLKKVVFKTPIQHFPMYASINPRKWKIFKLLTEKYDFMRAKYFHANQRDLLSIIFNL